MWRDKSHKVLVHGEFNDCLKFFHNLRFWNEGYNFHAVLISNGKLSRQDRNKLQLLGYFVVQFYFMKTIGLLLLSNIFMTFAWYGHLKEKGVPLWKAVLVSWGIAFFWILSDGSCQQVRICKWMEWLSVKSYTGDYYIGCVFRICGLLSQRTFWEEIFGKLFIYYGGCLFRIQKIKEALRERSALVLTLLHKTKHEFMYISEKIKWLQKI